VSRLRPLTEAECYTRCYGMRDDTVVVLRALPKPARPVARLSGEDLRRQLESRLDARDPAELIEEEAA
jgi:hypothetical protein